MPVTSEGACQPVGDKNNQTDMGMQLERLQNPLQKLRKQVKRLTEDSSVEEVHKLRTLTRRTEAMAAALRLDQEEPVRTLLKDLGPIRKAAGEVRDIDVLVAKVVGLSGKAEDECLVRLIEHLGSMRMKSARRLHEETAERRKRVRRELRNYSKILDRDAARKRRASRQVSGSSSTNAMAVAADYATELSRWPRLNADTIHPFRIKLKSLRYMLQLSGEASDPVVKALGAAKDVIGDWHDWRQLAEISAEVLDHTGECSLLDKIREEEARKLRQAIEIGNRVRAQYFSPQPLAGSSGKLPFKEPVLRATARLAS
jgi:CHAD domain-containing protein